MFVKCHLFFRIYDTKSCRTIQIYMQIQFIYFFNSTYNNRVGIVQKYLADLLKKSIKYIIIQTNVWHVTRLLCFQYVPKTNFVFLIVFRCVNRSKVFFIGLIIFVIIKYYYKYQNKYVNIKEVIDLSITFYSYLIYLVIELYIGTKIYL